MKALRLLVVEDDPAYLRLLQERLRDQAELELVESAGTLAEAIECARRTSIDVVLLDLGLPDSDGFETVASFRAAHGRIPIVVLSGRDSIAATVEAMRFGAQEYLVKGQGEAQLLPRVAHAAIERKRLQELEQLLVGVVSHDLRVPLQTIVLTCELLGPKLPEPERQRLSRALEAARRAGMLVNDLLDATRTRMGGLLPVEVSDIDLVPLVQSVVRDRHELTKREFDVATPTSLPIRADGPRIAQVLANLVGNAVQHSPAHERVTVTVRREGSDAVIEVHNGGQPIPDALLPRLFEPLERAQLTSQNHSIGLGLYIVNEIVKSHGGRIHVTSNASAGTIFAVRLPN